MFDRSLKSEAGFAATIRAGFGRRVHELEQDEEKQFLLSSNGQRAQRASVSRTN